MPASRWNSNILEMLNWLLEENDANKVDDLLLRPIVPHVLGSGEDPLGELSQATDGDSSIPAVLPILPLRGVVVFPQTAVPLTIGQVRSIRLVDDVMAGDERLIGLVTARNPELEAPEPADLYKIGTVAMVHRMFRAPDGTIRLVVQGLARFELGEFVQIDPYLRAEINLDPGNCGVWSGA